MQSREIRETHDLLFQAQKEGLAAYRKVGGLISLPSNVAKEIWHEPFRHYIWDTNFYSEYPKLILCNENPNVNIEVNLDSSDNLDASKNLDAIEEAIKTLKESQEPVTEINCPDPPGVRRGLSVSKYINLIPKDGGTAVPIRATFTADFEEFIRYLDKQLSEDGGTQISDDTIESIE